MAFDFFSFLRNSQRRGFDRDRQRRRSSRDAFLGGVGDGGSRGGGPESINFDLRDILKNGKTFAGLTEANQIAGYITARKSGSIPPNMTIEEYVRMKQGDTSLGRPPPEVLEQREAERQRRNEVAAERRARFDGKPDEGADRDKFLDRLTDAARDDFDRLDENINRANEDRRSRVDERDQLLRDNIDETRDRTDETVRTADVEARRIRADMNRFKNEILNTLKTRNQQFISETTAGVVTGIQAQMNQIDQRLAAGEIGEAEASALKNQLRQTAGKQASEIAGRAMSDFQNLFASTSATLSKQMNDTNQFAANMRVASRVQRQADMANAMMLAANGLFQSAQLMSVPDRFLSEFDSIINLTTAFKSFGGDEFSVERFRGDTQ